MAQLIDLGKIRFDYKGAYSGSTQYELNDVVKDNNNLYVYTASAASTGNAVSDTNFWDVMITNAASAYVDTSIANLVDSAPGTLNTLNELAAALGDDANFSTTVTNSIAAKLPLAGGTMTGDIAHASDLTFDVGGDIILDSDAANWRFKDAGTSILEIGSVSSGPSFFSAVSNANMLFKGNDGGSAITALTLDMSAAGAATFNSTVTATGADITGTLKIDEVIEKAAISTGTTGTINWDILSQAVIFYTNNQTSNRTINFRGDGSTTLDSVMAVGQSMSAAVLMTQGSTAYYPNTIQIDGSSITPKWQGGSAPTAGTASGIDVYTFTIIKTASATFTVLATVAQFA